MLGTHVSRLAAREARQDGRCQGHSAETGPESLPPLTCARLTWPRAQTLWTRVVRAPGPRPTRKEPSDGNTTSSWRQGTRSASTEKRPRAKSAGRHRRGSCQEKRSGSRNSAVVPGPARDPELPRNTPPGQAPPRGAPPPRLLPRSSSIPAPPLTALQIRNSPVAHAPLRRPCPARPSHLRRSPAPSWDSARRIRLPGPALTRRLGAGAAGGQASMAPTGGPGCQGVPLRGHPRPPCPEKENLDGGLGAGR